MGCTSSKQFQLGLRRTNSLPGRRRVVSGYHFVSLKSSTLGSLKLNDDNDEPMKKRLNETDMSWSDMIEKKRSSVTPPNEPETINVWELMEGLDDDDDVSPIRRKVERCHSFDGTDSTPVDLVSPSMSLVKARIQAFQAKINAKKALKKSQNANANAIPAEDTSHKCPPGGEGKVVFYFTSLRGIRKTYEDCCDVHLILKGYGIRIDERDTSMHKEFKEELTAILGPGFGGQTLPRVFAAGRYLGGAEEVKEMHENGQLEKAFGECGKAGGGPCVACGDMRFVPCETCSGSCKIFIQDGEVESKCVEPGGFRRCPNCNENGLVRCPAC